MKFFKDYFTKKNLCQNRKNNEKNNKLRSIICSIYLCYYTRLSDNIYRINFEKRLRKVLLQLINNEKIEEKKQNIIDLIKNKDLKDEILSRPEEKIEYNFSDFIKIEQNYLINQIKLEKGIGINYLLKDNLFNMVVAINTNIRFIIIGNPGTSKSLSAQLIYKSMKGEFSENKFFQLYPRVIQTYFKGSHLTQPEDIEKLFLQAQNKLEYYKDQNLE